MLKKLGLITLGGMLAVSGTLQAQTVTVAKTGSPDFATVQAAIDSFTPDPNAGVANVIQITDSAVYDEVFTVAVPVTIEGTGGSAPILACQQNPIASTGANDGFVVEIDNADSVADNTVTLRNLILIPSLTNTPADDLLRSNNGNLTLNLEDLVVTANDGANAPVHTDGVTPAANIGTATQVGDDSAFIGPAGIGPADTSVVNITNSVFSYASGDNLVCSGSAGTYNITGGAFTYGGRLGIQGNSNFNLVSSPTDKTLVLNNEGFAGIWFAGIGTDPRVVDGVVVSGTADTVAAIEFQNGGDQDATLANAIIANSTTAGIIIAAVGNVGNTYTIENVTFANNVGDPITVDAAATSTINIDDSIIAGTAGAGQINHAGSGTMTITNSALVGSGAFALNGTPTTGSGTINQSGVITDDPSFTNTTDADAPSTLFYNVTDTAYSAAGTGGAPLIGGGFGFGTDVDIWSEYTY